MKAFSVFLLLSLAFTGNRAHRQDDSVEFVCMKKHAASKTCHYNFKVDGAKFRYLDIGCKFKKTDDVIKKAKAGEIALAKDWKIECPEQKEKADTSN